MRRSEWTPERIRRSRAANDSDRGRHRSPRPRRFALATLAIGLVCAFPTSGCRTSNPDTISTSLSFVDGYPTFVSAQPGPSEGSRSAGDTKERLIHVVIEIPAGTNAKWEVDKETGGLHWEKKEGRPRVVRYLAYPGNYGMIPSTRLPYEIGGDGDPLDVLLLGPGVDRGAVVRARPIGILRLVDTGERDDKVLAVPTEGPLSDVVDLATLDEKYPGARAIVETWFTNYKGPGRIQSNGFGDAPEAILVVEEASRYFDADRPDAH